MLPSQPNLQCCRACCTRQQKICQGCLHAAGNIRGTRCKPSTLYCGESCSFTAWMFSFVFLSNNTCLSFSLSCTSVTELCRSKETTCTSDFSRMKEMHLRGRYTLTVSAKSASWEAFSDRYEITPSTIRMVNSTEKEKTSLSLRMCSAFGCLMIISFPQWILPDQSSASSLSLTVCWLNGRSGRAFQSMCITANWNTGYVNIRIMNGRGNQNIHDTVGTESRFTPSSIFYCFVWWSLVPKSQNFTLLIYTQHPISTPQTHNLRRKKHTWRQCVTLTPPVLVDPNILHKRLHHNTFTRVWILPKVPCVTALHTGNGCKLLLPSPVDGKQARSLLCCNSNVQKRLRTDVSDSFQAVSVDPPQVRDLHFPHIEILTFHGCAWALVYCQWVINTTLRNCNKAATTIEDVESCRNYTFAARCAVSEAPWSSWSHETTLLTQLNSETEKKLQIAQIYCRSR